MSNAQEIYTINTINTINSLGGWGVLHTHLMGQCSVGNSERDDGKIWGNWTETLTAAQQSKGAYFNKL